MTHYQRYYTNFYRTIYKFSGVTENTGAVEYAASYVLEKEFPLLDHVVLRHMIMLADSKAYAVGLVNDTDALITV